MHIAAHVKDGEKCAEMLLKSGADVNATQEVGVGIYKHKHVAQYVDRRRNI